MVPVQACGFEQLTQRRNWQDTVEKAQRLKMAEIQRRIGSLLSKQDLDLSAQLQAVQKQQLRLSRRLLALMQRMAHSSMSSEKEQALLGRLQAVTNRLEDGSLRANAISSLEERAASMAEGDHLDPLAALRTESSISPDLESLISSQQLGISLLVDRVNRDAHDLDIMRHGYVL